MSLCLATGLRMVGFALAVLPAAGSIAAGMPPSAISELTLGPGPVLTLRGPGEEGRLFVTARLSGGRTIDVTSSAKLTISGGCVTLLRGNEIRARSQGRSRVTAEYGGRQSSVLVQVVSPREWIPSWRQDVLPVLSRSGCNQGACHGNSLGRGGFLLSLKGEDPDRDLDVVARAGGGRRIDRIDPGRSLLLRKSAGLVPHGGGRRFAPDSWQFRVLARWIGAGARADDLSAPALVGIDATPREAIVEQPTVFARVTATARYSDGSRRDVTSLAAYQCAEPSVQVGPEGTVDCDRGGDAPILVRFADQMSTARIIFIPRRPRVAWTAPPAANVIDELQYSRLRALRLHPSPPASDPVFLRRVFLDTLGVLPTPDEARAFLVDSRPDRRARLIESLLTRSEFDDFWAMKWGDLLRSEERSLDPTGIVAYRDYLRAAISRRMPLDQLARELLTSSGSTYKQPAANYYRRTRAPEELAETSAQIFMGTRLLCARCHNHPTEKWRQDDYYALAAYFARVDRKIENLTRRDKFDLHEMIGEEMIQPAEKGEVRHPRTRAVVAPHLPGSPPDPRHENGDRRVHFATWLTSPSNPYFSRALANRIWYHLNGRGLVDAVDDLRESNPASNPALLDRLALELRQSGYDLRALARLILNSHTYQAASETTPANAGDDRFFSHAVAQRVPAEVLLDAIAQVTGVPEAYAGFPPGTRATQLPAVRTRNPFLLLFGQPTRETVCECDRTSDTTLGQSFALLSGDVIDSRVRRKDNRLGALISLGKDDTAIIEELYLAAYARFPDAAEMKTALGFLQQKSDRRSALEDLLWAILNSSQFLLRR